MLTKVQHYCRLKHVSLPVKPDVTQGINTKAVEAKPFMFHMPKTCTVIAQEREDTMHTNNYHRHFKDPPVPAN